MVKKYSLDHDKVAEILKDLQKYYTELSSESENAKYADMIYTDEEKKLSPQVMWKNASIYSHTILRF